jgi:hypothetical protein
VWKHGLDYAQFKLFQMSLLWRCSIATAPHFSAVALGPHEERVRQMLAAGNPGDPWKYGCIIAALRQPASLQGMVKFPGQLRIEGHYAYHFVVWGLVWFFVVSSHTDHFRGKGSFLSKSGDLPIHVSSKTAQAFLTDMARKLTKAGKSL